VLYDVSPDAKSKSTSVPVPRPRRNEVGVQFYNHPFDRGHLSNDDVAGATLYGYEGLVVTYVGSLWGYDGTGYRD
jgi:hypothetical protein